MADDRTIMAVDAGGTDTRCVVSSFDGQVLGYGSGGPGDHVLHGWQTVRNSIHQATSEALQSANLRGSNVEVVMAGSAGLSADAEGRETVEQLLVELVPGAARVRATGDMVTAFWGALRTPIGVVVSAGVGAVCFGRNVTGETCEVGGWGPVMGDEGSAHDIAVQAVRAVARAADGRGEPTVLSEILMESLHVANEVEMAARLFADSAEREKLAQLAPQVVAAAQRGDAVAMQILRYAAKELAIGALTALRHLSLLNTAASVSFSGSVFEAGRLIIDPFRRAIHDASPHSSIEAPLLPPIGGAFRLGLQAVGYTMDEPIIYRFARGLVEVGM